ncbi:class I SAM-dependent methyltransferase [bacterium]|nr:class I SAM-dependent methyltransferase [bacterium]
MLSGKYRSWRDGFLQRKKYCHMDRRPYYDVAARFLPSSPSAVVVDIGSGDGSFVEHLALCARFPETYLLDANLETIFELAGRFAHALTYRAPERLPFADSSVHLVHSSHLIEHLQPAELLSFLIEIDRVLAPDGVLVISTPMVWKGFYSDLSHVRPYNPGVLTHYLADPGRSRSARTVSTGYRVEELVYRFARVHDLSEGWGSSHLVPDLLIQLAKRLCEVIGIYRFEKTGYTIVLRKSGG